LRCIYYYCYYFPCYIKQSLVPKQNQFSYVTFFLILNQVIIIYLFVYTYCKTLLPTKIKVDPKSKSKWTHQARMHYTYAHKWVISTLYLFIYFLKFCVCVRFNLWFSMQLWNRWSENCPNKFYKKKKNWICIETQLYP
jgi:hypothetical protein